MESAASDAPTDDSMVGEEIEEGKEDVLLEVGCGPGNMLYPVSDVRACASLKRC
jgi:ubiquinone/menaquinone biosynthesis C-methylase UbiE